jgi:hypothetical protein
VIPEPPTEARANPRSNMFLAALLRGADFSAPVKIRNMSAAGALVEAPAVPQRGAEVQLIRGSLAVPAIVAWSTPGRCGLHFASLVCVRDWLAPVSNSAQQQVDDAVRLLKAGAVPMPPRSAVQDRAREPASAELGRDLRSAARLIEELGDGLSTDEQVLASHADKLQNLDIALQIIAVVADALDGGNAGSIGERLQNLRASCAAAVQKPGTAGSA